MGSVKLTSLSDVHVGQDQPTKNYVAGASMYIRNWSGSARLGFLHFPCTFPRGATITSAKLHFYAYAKPVSGSVTMYVKRLKQTVNYNKLTWNTRPTQFYSTTELSATKTGTYPDREEWVIDITADMQAVSDGNAWYGYQLRTNWTGTNWSPRFMSAQHPNPDLRPWVEITWSDAPDTPTQLAPAGGRVVSTPQPILRCDYSDVAGDTDIAGIQVQISTVSSFVSTVYNSLAQSVDAPQWDLTGTTFTATEGTTYYWRARVQDGAGLWSQYSSGAAFVYKPAPTIEIQNPGATPNNYVEEPTPPITWNVLTGSQASYQLGFYRRDGDKDVLLWSRPRTYSTSTDGFVLPAGLITQKNATYRIDVRVYDDEDREYVPNGKPWAQLTRYFTYQFSALTTPVENLVATVQDPRPGVQLEWDRDTAPDSYSIIRDGVVIAADLDPDDDTWVEGTHNAWFDPFPVKGKAHTYSVQAIVNGKASSANPTQTVTNNFPGTWIMDADASNAVCILNDHGRSMEYGEQSEVFTPLGSKKSVLVTQGMRGYEGEISGQIVGGITGLNETVQDWRRKLLALKSVAGQKLYLFFDDRTFPVVISNVNETQAPNVKAQVYNVSFRFLQQGEYSYSIRL